MQTDRSLTTLLRALQNDSDPEDIFRLLGSATTLLTLLTNPLNVTLLTAHLLSARSIWQRQNGLRMTVYVLGIFRSAAAHFLQREASSATHAPLLSQGPVRFEGWATAIVKGADGRSPRWKHLCVLVGLLLALDRKSGQSISSSLQGKLGVGTVNATNLALLELDLDDEIAANSIAVMVSLGFDLLDNTEQMSFDHGRLLPIVYRGPLLSPEGLHWGYFLSNLDADIVQIKDMKFAWSNKSSTYTQCQRMIASPLISSLGSLSRVMAFATERTTHIDLLFTMVEDLLAFTNSFCIQWRQNKLSEIDISEESTFLDDESTQETLPLLWRILKSSMFAIVICLKSLLGRVLRDARLSAAGAPPIAMQTLHVLRNLYFISSRLGSDPFSQYKFVHLTAIDILSHYPVQAEAFLREIKPVSVGTKSQHPLDRCHDLFFLNTAEHFASVLSAELNVELLVSAATPYLGLSSDARLLDIHEAAHSVMLAALLSSTKSITFVKHIIPYLETLFRVFPQSVSPRQFRIAIKTLIRTTSPPSMISESQPLLPSIILDLVRLRSEQGSSELLPQSMSSPTSPDHYEQPQWSEQSVLVVTIIDALPYLPRDQLEDWLTRAANCLKFLHREKQLALCTRRLWEVLTNGVMDADRAAFCISWWTTGGGREEVLDCQSEDDGPFMSGAIQETSSL